MVRMKRWKLLAVFLLFLVLIAAGCASSKPAPSLISISEAQLGASYEVGVYVATRGDSVPKICNQFQIAIRDFLAINPGLDPRRLRTGQAVRVYERLKRNNDASQ